MPPDFDATRAVRACRSIAYAATVFRRDHGHWPSEEQLRSETSLPRRDPWRRPFHVAIDDRGVVVTSLGPDGVLGTCDDVATEPLSAQW